MCFAVTGQATKLLLGCLSKNEVMTKTSNIIFQQCGRKVTIQLTKLSVISYFFHFTFVRQKYSE